MTQTPEQKREWKRRWRAANPEKYLAGLAKEAERKREMRALIKAGKPPPERMNKRPRKQAVVARDRSEISKAAADAAKRRQDAQKKPRRCLSCLTMFDSRGPGNRICPRCTSGITYSGDNGFHDTSASY